ncbi:wee1-like protein kinase [Uloborus diversus]|uniref:wee1-like protein kinase n=1 Tax=Uloborus diversus TaxID=327109 RepID=UPI002409BC05|nr:wee1-like protein kinase [Uloborus diversus]
MSFIQPRSLFTVEDDGLIQRLDFSDSDEPTDDSDKISSPDQPRSSPIEGDTDEDEQLDSSSDSLMTDLTSTVRRPALTRRLNLDVEVENVDTTLAYRKVRALRLFESPQSPKTILKQSELTPGEEKDTSQRTLSPQIGSYDYNHNMGRGRRSKHFYTPQLETNINPFTQNSISVCSLGKRRRDSGYSSFTFNDGYYSDRGVKVDLQPNKRIHLKEKNMSRYKSEFLELEEIGSGEFGSVFRCINRLDGCEYAIKKSRKPLKGTSNERVALNEVYAHAVLGHHKHVVRYFSAWAENDHMLIQNEFCNGGSLAQAIEEKKKQQLQFLETDVKQILLHIALGLRYIHSLNLVHMDIKPGNIFITKQSKLPPSPNSSSDDGFEEDSDLVEEEVIYKIGDLGHVTSVLKPKVEEGDCRYIPAEFLRDDYSHLPKADIFALGLTIYEVCGGGPLPKNGEEWHSIREGNLPYLSGYSKELNDLLKQMIHPDPDQRPSSASLVHNQTLVPYVGKTKEQLNRELAAEKFKNQLLSRQLEKASLSLKKGISTESRLGRIVGRKTNNHSCLKFNRSSSVTF